MMKIILFFILILLTTSCDFNNDNISPNVKILSKKETSKILKNSKKIDPNLRKKIIIKKISIKTNTGKILKISSKSYEKINKKLEKKEKKEKEKIKTTLDDLEFLKYKNDLAIATRKNNPNLSKPSSEIELNVSDKIRAIFKPVVNNYSLRHVKFKNIGNDLSLDTISLRYENKEKRISLEVLPLTLEPLRFIKKGQKDFFYKNYKLNNISINLSINYKLKLINGVFNNLGYTWVINAQNIDDKDDIIDIIRNINFNLFMELKAKYEKE